MSDEIKKFLDYKKNVLDVHSSSICAAKWMDATIWLYSGVTASCHHPPSHKISESEINNDPSALHNTQQKKIARAQMQKGERPSECEYCWKIEDLSENSISDRVFHSLDSDFNHIKTLKDSDHQKNFNPRRLEIAFDRICNFACSYCSPSYSSSWVADIKKNGPYKNLHTDFRNHYIDTHPSVDPYADSEKNPFIAAFWQWWPDLKKDLKQLRITGGEPLMSPNFWKLLDQFQNEELPDLQLAVNSNLGSRFEIIEKLIDQSHYIKHLEIYTSNEAFGAQAEYIRDGLDFELWKNNIYKLKKLGNIKKLHLMMTISGLSLFSITEMLDLVMQWKAEFGCETPIVSLNIVRWPTFQSPLVLPTHLRRQVSQNLKNWLEKNSTNPLLLNFEINHCNRLIQYLDNAVDATAITATREELEKDLKKFLIQYDKRRNKSFNSTFGTEVVDWIKSINLN